MELKLVLLLTLAVLVSCDDETVDCKECGLKEARTCESECTKKGKDACETQCFFECMGLLNPDGKLNMQKSALVFNQCLSEGGQKWEKVMKCILKEGSSVDPTANDCQGWSDLHKCRKDC